MIPVVKNETPHDVLYEKVKELLSGFAKDEKSRDEIAPLVAEKSLEMNHLYQDLGFKSRIEMGRFMKEHFPKLAEQRPPEKLWKKYIYDLIGETAPACEDCKDQVNCFACRV